MTRKNRTVATMSVLQQQQRPHGRRSFGRRTAPASGRIPTRTSARSRHPHRKTASRTRGSCCESGWESTPFITSLSRTDRPDAYAQGSPGNVESTVSTSDPMSANRGTGGIWGVVDAVAGVVGVRRLWAKVERWRREPKNRRLGSLGSTIPHDRHGYDPLGTVRSRCPAEETSPHLQPELRGCEFTKHSFQLGSVLGSSMLGARGKDGPR